MPGQDQSQNGCWSFDTNSTWQDTLKSGASCAAASISLPDNIEATSYTSHSTWGDLCNQIKIEDIPAGSQNYNLKTATDGTPACGFYFRTPSAPSNNTSVIITGTNGKKITYPDPNVLIYGKGYNQDTMGCWSLDADDNWKAALKDGSYCRVKSITLPSNVKASSYTTTGGWGNLCSDTHIEDIPAGSTDYLLKSTSGGTPACGFLFSKA